jgi:two-component system, OmpR family, sensor histidine kinase BaeS
MTQSTCEKVSTDPNLPGGVQFGVATIWWGAAIIAAFATWVLFGARPGINLFLCLLAVLLLGLALEPGAPASRHRLSWVADAAALILAGSLAVAAGGPTTGLVALAVVWLSALSIVQQLGQAPMWSGLVRLLAVPFAALSIVISQAAGRTGDAVRSFRGGRYVAMVRGAAWALPTVLVFFLLLANADPTFEAWRSQGLDALRNLTFLPRMVFWLLLSVLMLGRLSLSAQRRTVTMPNAGAVNFRAHRTATERSIALGSVALLFALFLVLQLNVLFGDPGGRTGSGMTFAQAVHRGFVELTAVVTLTALLILVLDAAALRAAAERKVRVLSVILLAQCLLILASAWVRLLGYEQAYGYSILRMYLHVYIIWVGAGLTLLAWEVATNIEAQRVVRRAIVAGLVCLTAVAYVNLPAWVVERNISLYEQGSALDRHYLVYGGGLDALPTIERLLPRLDVRDRSSVQCLIQQRYGGDRGMLREPEHWFEWNLRRRAARAALTRLMSAAQDCAVPDGEH